MVKLASISCLVQLTPVLHVTFYINEALVLLTQLRLCIVYYYLPRTQLMRVGPRNHAATLFMCQPTASSSSTSCVRQSRSSDAFTSSALQVITKKTTNVLLYTPLLPYLCIYILYKSNRKGNSGTYCWNYSTHSSICVRVYQYF